MKKGHVLEVDIYEAGARGMGVGKTEDGMLVFVSGAVPGDRVKVQVRKKKSRYAEAVLQEVTHPSSLRVAPACAHFGTCGGCKWQNLAYDAQLEAKHREVVNTLKHQGGIEPANIQPILGAPDALRYRNKMEYSAYEGRWLTAEQIASGQEFDRRALGFHPPGRWDRVLHITDCHLQPELGNRIRNFIFDHAMAHGMPFFEPRQKLGTLRSVMIRNTQANEWMVAIQFFTPFDEAQEKLLTDLQAAFPEITCLYRAYNPKANDSIYDLDMVHVAGEPWLTETMERFNQTGAPLRFKISPKSFYQTNAKQAERLYHAAATMAGLTGKEVVYDLYTGTGTIAQYVAHLCAKVVGVEGVPAAIEDAKANAQANGIENATFLVGDMKQVFDDAFVATHGAPDVIITDPPREGMHPDVVAMLLKVGASRMVYVSCNPATQARDLALMKDHYRVLEIQPVDMFPHTHHVENIALLERIEQSN